MAELITVARPYAEAMFRTAKEVGQLPQFSAALGKMAALASDAQMADVLANPRFSLTTKLDLFKSVMGGESHPTAENLVSMLVESRRAVLLPHIAAHFEALKREHESTLVAIVTSARALSEADVQGLVAAISAKRGKKVVAEVRIDPELIGGVRIQIGDEVLSGSVRDQLNQMAAALAA
jgi:F-type H+-transporting ATPase subunit delta